MSRVYFHTQHEGEAELPGYIRRQFGRIISELFVLSLSISLPFEKHPLFLIAPDWVTNDNLARLHFGSKALYGEIDGLDCLDLTINTAILMGNKSVKLAAYIYGYCETHGYFDPEDFDWLRQSIDCGIAAGFYGSQSDWSDVLALINKATGPIVMSYSGCDRFPRNKQEGWDAAFEEIKDGQRFSPSLDSVGHGLNGWQLVERLSKKPCE
jgi:hypothetical protein